MGCGSLQGSDGNWLCAKCARAMQPLAGLNDCLSYICRSCGEEMAGYICGECGLSAGTYPAAAAYGYDDIVKGIIENYKFRGVYRMDAWMASEMAKAIENAGLSGYSVITCVPLHKSRENERGYNQSRKLAEKLSAITGVPFRELLVRTRRTKQQAKLSREERRENLKNAFSCGQDLNGETVLLVDDVRTTGSTCVRCAEEIIKAGAKAVYIATFASAGR